MKRMLLPLLAVMLMFVSCGTSPLNFNNTLNDSYSIVVDTKTTYDNMLVKLVEDSAFSKIESETDLALAKIDSQIVKIKAVEPISGGEELKESVVKACEALRNVVEMGKKYSNLTSGSTQEELNALDKEYSLKEDEYSKAFDEMNQIQVAFAEKNNLELE